MRSLPGCIRALFGCLCLAPAVLLAQNVQGAPTGGMQCLINGKYVFVAKGGCPASNNGASNANASAAAEAERQRQAAEAERRRQEEEALRSQEQQRQRQAIEEDRRLKEQQDQDRHDALLGVKGLDQASGAGLKQDDNAGGPGLKGLGDVGDGGEFKDAVNSNPAAVKTSLDELQQNLSATGTGLRSQAAEGKTTGVREDASHCAGTVFDGTATGCGATAVRSTINPSAALRDVGKLPAVQALLAHIPEQARNDRIVVEQVAWYGKLESMKAEKWEKIAELQRRLEHHEGDTSILNVEKQQLKNDIAQATRDQQSAQDAIRKQVSNDGLAWIEEPAAEPSGNKEKTQ